MFIRLSAADRTRVTCIAPGLLRTELAKGLVEAVETGVSPIQSPEAGGEPNEIAGLALFLASLSGAFATGMTYVGDGGRARIGGIVHGVK